MNQEIDLTQVAAAHSGSIDAQALGGRRPGAQAQESRRPGEVENDLEIGERDRGDLAVLDAAPDLGPIPVVLDPPLQPGGVVPEAVLLVPPAGDDPPGAAVGDDEGEDGECEEEHDEEEERDAVGTP